MEIRIARPDGRVSQRCPRYPGGMNLGEHREVCEQATRIVESFTATCSVDIQQPAHPAVADHQLALVQIAVHRDVRAFGRFMGRARQRLRHPAHSEGSDWRPLRPSRTPPSQRVWP